MPVLTLLAGLPGAGKSTYAQAHHGGALLLSADKVRSGSDPTRVFRRMRLLATKTLRAGLDVWIDACSLTARERARWLTLARLAHAETRLVLVRAPVHTCRARNSQRADPAPWRASKEALAERLLPDALRERWGRVTVVCGVSGQAVAEHLGADRA